MKQKMFSRLKHIIYKFNKRKENNSIITKYDKKCIIRQYKLK